MSKKKILALVMTGMMLVPTVAYAKGNPHNSVNNGQQVVNQEKSAQSPEEKSKKENGQAKKEDKNKGDAKKQQNQEKKDEKKQQIEAFKTQMKAKHETMKEIRQQTIALKQQVEAKSTQLKAIIADIEAGNKTLSDDMLNALLAKAENLKLDSEEVKATAGVNKVTSEVQDQVNKKDFNNALSSLDKVISKLQARLDALKKLNADLDDALAIANLATTPAPSSSTDSTQSQTTTSGTTTDTTTSDSTTTSSTTTSDGTSNTINTTTDVTSGN